MAWDAARAVTVYVPLSILYLRCVRVQPRPHIVIQPLPFNSLFEMQEYKDFVDVKIEDKLSILYLRCSAGLCGCWWGDG